MNRGSELRDPRDEGALSRGHAAHRSFLASAHARSSDDPSEDYAAATEYQPHEPLAGTVLTLREMADLLICPPGYVPAEDLLDAPTCRRSVSEPREKIQNRE
jgi:hypothetical protein